MPKNPNSPAGDGAKSKASAMKRDAKPAQRKKASKSKKSSTPKDTTDGAPPSPAAPTLSSPALPPAPPLPPATPLPPAPPLPPPTQGAGQNSGEENPSTEELISIWAKAVDTQMHFNEMSAKSRQLGLTFVAAALGVGVVLMGNRKDFRLSVEVCGYPFIVHVTVLLILAALLALIGVRKLDLGVYHRMLRGAVTFGEDFEETVLRPRFFTLNKGMTEAISHFSRHSDAKSDGKPRVYSGSNKKAAEDKIKSFYNVTMGFLLIAAIIIFAFTNMSKKESDPETSTLRVEVSNTKS